MIQLLTEENLEQLTEADKHLQKALTALEEKNVGTLSCEIYAANSLIDRISLRSSKTDFRVSRLESKLKAAQALLREIAAAETSAGACEEP